MSSRTAVYAGTFDPITNGHLWMIQRGSAQFDRLIVAIGVNPKKKCLFSVDERVELIRSSTVGLDNITVDAFPHKYLIKYAKRVGAQFILRGIRNENDYLNERAMRHVNHDIDPSITTVFLMPDRELSEVSSSMVKDELVGPEDWEEVVPRYVPECVFKKLKEEYYGRKVS